MCFNSESITLNKTYASDLGFDDNIIRASVHLYNTSDVLLHTSVTPPNAADAVQVSGSSSIMTGFGAEIYGGENCSGLVLRGRSTGKLMVGTKITGTSSTQLNLNRDRIIANSI